MLKFLNNSILFFYNILIFILSIILFPFFLIKKKTKSHLRERYGLWDIDSEGAKEVIWFHGASMGEVNGLLPVIKKLKEKDNTQILLTTTSVAGREHGRKNGFVTFLFPFDTSFYLNKVFQNFNIKKIVITETEIWPIFIKMAKKKNIPLYLVNARISENTINKYYFLKFFISSILNNFEKILPQTQKDLDYFKKVGVIEEKLKICGNSKYEMNLKVRENDEKEKLKRKFFPNEKIDKIITFASIRPKEEEFFIDQIKNISKNFKDIGIIIAPRHKEKFEYFKDVLKTNDISFMSWSKKDKAEYKNIILLDTFGDLENVFSFSSMAFIGATLIDKIGGHNPMEAMKYGAYVFIGPYYYNYQDIIDYMVNINSASVIKSKEDFEDLLNVFLTYPELICEKGKRGVEYCKKLSGATDIIVGEIID